MVTEVDVYNWNVKPYTVTLTYLDGAIIVYKNWSCSKIRHGPKRHPETKQRYVHINIWPEPIRSNSWVELEYVLAVFDKHPSVSEWALSYNDLGNSDGN